MTEFGEEKKGKGWGSWLIVTFVFFPSKWSSSTASENFHTLMLRTCHLSGTQLSGAWLLINNF